MNAAARAQPHSLRRRIGAAGESIDKAGPSGKRR